MHVENQSKELMAAELDRLYGGCVGAPGGVWR